jgi:hypothetical protein
MKFKRAILKTPALATAYRPGLQALRAADIEHITCQKPRILAGSIDVDATLNNALPTAPRWDYAIGVRCDRNTDAVIWIEVHPASSTSNVKDVVNKLNWLKRWSAQPAPALVRLTREYVWVSTGPVAFTANSPHRRQLATVGIRFAGKQYDIQAN